MWLGWRSRRLGFRNHDRMLGQRAGRARLELRQAGGDRRAKAFGFPTGIVEPVRAPNPVNFPAEVFEDFLAMTVAIASRFGRMICCPVAFDSHDEAIGPFRVSETEIDRVANDADRGTAVHPMASICWAMYCSSGESNAPCVPVEDPRSPPALYSSQRLSISAPSVAAFFRENITACHGRERSDLFLGAAEENVETTLTGRPVQRTESLADSFTGCRWTVNRRYENHVAFVALHVFEVLDEELLETTPSLRSSARRTRSPSYLLR